MSLTIESVVIVIVVVSVTVLAVIVFALYWLWRLLLEDRRCALVNGASFTWSGRQAVPGFAVLLPTAVRARTPPPDAEHTEPLTSNSCEDCPHERGNDVMVDERSFRMTRSKRPKTSQKARRNPESSSPDVVVLDGTEPPPPYEGATW